MGDQTGSFYGQLSLQESDTLRSTGAIRALNLRSVSFASARAYNAIAAMLSSKKAIDNLRTGSWVAEACWVAIGVLAVAGAWGAAAVFTALAAGAAGNGSVAPGRSGHSVFVISCAGVALARNRAAANPIMAAVMRIMFWTFMDHPFSSNLTTLPTIAGEMPKSSKLIPDGICWENKGLREMAVPATASTSSGTYPPRYQGI